MSDVLPFRASRKVAPRPACVTPEDHEYEASLLVEMAFAPKFRAMFGQDAADDNIFEAARHIEAARILRAARPS